MSFMKCPECQKDVLDRLHKVEEVLRVMEIQVQIMAGKLNQNSIPLSGRNTLKGTNDCPYHPWSTCTCGNFKYYSYGGTDVETKNES